jgi:trans-aconitate methyltransferase
LTIALGLISRQASADRVDDVEPPERARARTAGAFDKFAHQYDTLLDKSLQITGEDKEYFARGRLEWLAQRLAQLNSKPRTVLDFGCGSGSTIPLFFESLGANHVIALDESAELLNIAARRYGHLSVSFSLESNFDGRESCDLVFCSAVFHHIPPPARLAVARTIRTYLAPAGFLALWEHNAWSPAARYVMSRCEFDRDARPLSASLARTLLTQAGFEVVATDFLFIYPRFLRLLRWSERLLAKLPLGAQFQVLARKIG